MFLVIITKGETERSMRRMRVFCLACRCFGRGGETTWSTIKPRCTLYQASTGQDRRGQERTGEEGESQTIRYCNISVSLSMSLWLFLAVDIG